jgi:hypothetical protein
MRCTRRHGTSYGIHVELYARGLVVPLPAGIGIAPPQRRSGAYVRGGACSYPVRTYEPTGVVVLDTGRPRTLRALFAVWGQPLGARRLAGFEGPLGAFVDGRRWLADPAAIPLRRHAEIVLEVGPRVLPHSTYRFPPGR